MNKIGNQELTHILKLSQFLVCSKCNLTEQRTRCEVIKIEKQKCTKTLCRNCVQSNIDKECRQLFADGCQKKIKQHRSKFNNKQKMKNDIITRFQNQSKFREKIKQTKYTQINEDMTHILAALLIQSNGGSSSSTLDKQLDKLVDDIQTIKNTVQSQVDRGNLPVLKQCIQRNPSLNCDGGISACGFQLNNYDKGFAQLLKSFQ